MLSCARPLTFHFPVVSYKLRPKPHTVNFLPLPIHTTFLPSTVYIFHPPSHAVLFFTPPTYHAAFQIKPCPFCLQVYSSVTCRSFFRVRIGPEALQLAAVVILFFPGQMQARRLRHNHRHHQLSTKCSYLPGTNNVRYWRDRCVFAGLSQADSSLVGDVGMSLPSRAERTYIVISRFYSCSYFFKT